MKMGWRMRRERMISGLTTYFSLFFFCTTTVIRMERFCGLERCRNEFGGGGVT